MKIPYINLKKQSNEEEYQLIKIFKKNLALSEFINSKSVEKFEKKISEICKVKYCVALNSGTDALTMGLKLLEIKRGDEVITPPNSFISSTASIVHIGATPVFVDIKKDQNIDEKKIEAKITKKTKAIMPVHLTGRMCNMDEIIRIAKKYQLKVIEDSAQSIMSKFNNKPSGSFGDVGCFSAHPLKNLNALGDSGFMITNNSKIYEQAKTLRNHGSVERNIVKNFGYVSRMDTIQADILLYRIKKLKKIILQRRKNFLIYKSNLNLSKDVYYPLENDKEFNTYHTFVIQVSQRDFLKKFLKKKGVETSIHYPVPIHLQPASNYMGYKIGSFPETEKQSKEILTLPINQYLKKNEILYICKLINQFYEN